MKIQKFFSLFTIFGVEWPKNRDQEKEKMEENDQERNAQRYDNPTKKEVSPSLHLIEIPSLK